MGRRRRGSFGLAAMVLLAGCVVVPYPARSVLDEPASVALPPLAPGERIAFVKLRGGPVPARMLDCVEERAGDGLDAGAVVPQAEVKGLFGAALAWDAPPPRGSLATALDSLLDGPGLAERLRAAGLRYVVAVDAGRWVAPAERVLGGEWIGIMSKQDLVTAEAAWCDLHSGTCAPGARAHADESVRWNHVLPNAFLFSVVLVGMGGETAACDALAAALLERLAQPAS